MSLAVLAASCAPVAAAPWLARNPLVSVPGQRLLARPGDRVLQLARICPTPCDIRVLEIDREGFPVRDLRVGGSLSEFLQGADTLPDGSVVLAALVSPPGMPAAGVLIVLDGKLSLRAGLRLHDFAPSCVRALSNGEFLVGGSRSGLAALVRVGIDGSVRWAMILRDRPDSTIADMVEMPDRGVVVLTALEGSSSTDDGMVLKVSSDGEIEWQRLFATANYDTVRSVSLAPDGAAEFAVFTNPETAMIAMTQEGTVIRRRAFRWEGFATDVWFTTRDPAGRLVLSGFYRGFGDPSGVAVTVLEADDSLAWGGAYALTDRGHGLGGPPVFTSVDVMWVLHHTLEADGTTGARLARTVGQGALDPRCAPIPLVPIVEAVADPPMANESFDPMWVVVEPEPIVVTSITTDLFELCRGAETEPPSEVSPRFSPWPLLFVSPTDFQWESPEHSGSESFDVYRGLVSDLRASRAMTCLATRLRFPSLSDPTTPGPGDAWFYLVGGRNVAGRGTLGHDSLGSERVAAIPCP